MSYIYSWDRLLCGGRSWPKFFDLFGFACMDRTQLYPKHDATKHDATNSTPPNRSTLSSKDRCGPAHPCGVMTARPLILPPWSSRYASLTRSNGKCSTSMRIFPARARLTTSMSSVIEPQYGEATEHSCGGL